MTDFLASYGGLLMSAVFGVTFLGGFTKGAVGFALPMIMISGIGSLMSAELAIAALILPTLITNFQQSVRNGLSSAGDSLRKYWKLNLILVVMIFLCAQIVSLLSDQLLYLILGGMISSFGLLQLAGWKMHFDPRHTGFIEIVVALVAGFMGGISGVWGPPILMYLLARNTPRQEMMRVQGISFLIGSIVLLGAHLQSGVLNSVTLPFSALLVIPAFAGLLLGQKLQDRLEPAPLKRLILIVLVVAGLNLLRRGLVGFF